ncbi:MAG: hypothetical protein H6Q77_709 [Gemmatimonadetes bacterium]|nr:hypothetical protein [Gemmatimonadota bacterium]
MLILRTVLLAAGLWVASDVHAAPAAAQATITCESKNNKFKDCRVETGGAVRLQQTLSTARCEYGRTWGFDWNSVWVDRGCRGRFLVNGSGTGWESGNWGQRVTCESQQNSYKICPVKTYGYVRLARQLSQAPCVAGNTWGYKDDQIWVGNGCRAEFLLGSGNSNWEGDLRIITCQSQDGRYSRCFAPTEGQVTLHRQLSNTTCVLNRNWGFDANGVWVDNGCRGEFAVGGGSGSGWGGYPGAGGGANLQRAGAACSSEAVKRGYQNVGVDNASQSGSIVFVYLRAFRNSREYSVGCQYALSSNRVQITSEDQVTGGAGGGSNVAQRGRDACANRASTMGYQSINVTSSRQSGSSVTVTMAARNQNRPWTLTCIYRQPDGTATITSQEAGSGSGGGNLFADAKTVCESQARRLGYQVTRWGPAQQQSWGVKQEFSLAKGGRQYNGADCNYNVNSRSATVAPGNPD